MVVRPEFFRVLSRRDVLFAIRLPWCGRAASMFPPLIRGGNHSGGPGATRHHGHRQRGPTYPGCTVAYNPPLPGLE